MNDPGCLRWAELQSAFVDGALPEVERERMVGHLLSCDSCRAEVAELRALRRMLGRADPRHAPSDLSQRLVSIAGDEAAEPLRFRPFNRTARVDTVWRLPGRRRRWRLRAAAAAMATSTALVSVGLVGYAAAPGRGAAQILDPDAEARVAFTSTLGQSSWSGASLAAVNLVDTADLHAPRTVAGPPTDATGDPLDQHAVLAVLRRSADEVGALSYRGRQSFTAYRDGSAVAAMVDVQSVAGEGLEMHVSNLTGDPLIQHFSPIASTSRVVDDDLLDLLDHHYVLGGRSGATVAGRPATAVVASRGGAVSARWWIDDATGVLLWHETYDEAGSAELSYGFTSITFSDRTYASAHFPARLGGSTVNVALTLSSRSQVETLGWVCPSRLVRMSLVRLRTDRRADPSMIQADYSDGVATVSVRQQRGRLGSVPEGMTWDRRLQTYVAHGASESATWQSGDTVFTVVTDGSESLLASAVDSLPHSGAGSTSTMEEIMAGWAEILADLRG